MAKKRSNKKKVPQKGDPDFLSPTQLRNRRKRNAKKKQNQDGNTDVLGDNSSGSGGGSNKAAGGSTNKRASVLPKDPSMKYISNPIKAPIVNTAKQYFQPILKEDEFNVHLGPLYKWRTVSKLAVRAAAAAHGNSPTNSKPKVAIGLFLPQSHTLLPVPNCRAHHPSINAAVECITRACHEVGVVPYQQENAKSAAKKDGASVVSGDENNKKTRTPIDMTETGTGQLSYVAINIARETGAAQITMVWNAPPPEDDDGDDDGSKKRKYDDPVLERLVAKLISMSKTDSNAALMINDANRDKMGTDENSANDAIAKAADEDQPVKKRRRRGRREGKSTDMNDTDEVTRGSTHKGASTVSDIPSKGRSNQPTFNLHSLWINYNPSWKHSNAIFSFDSSCWKHVHGPRAVIEHLAFDDKKKGPSNKNELLASPKPPSFAVPLTFPPNVFRQANLDAFTNIVGRIRERVQTLDKESGNDKLSCVELYGGVGTIGLHVSDVVSSLVSSDENPNNSKCFYESAAALPKDIQSKLTYKQKNAADMVATEQALFQKSNVLIVDPPRKGLEDEVVEYLCNEGYKKLKLMVYVSCGFQAFQRDCDALMKSGKWKVEFAEGYLLFPGSDAIETLAFFVPN